MTTDIPQLINGAKEFVTTGFKSMVEGVKNYPIMQREVAFAGGAAGREVQTIGDAFSDLKNGARDFYNWVVGKSDDAGEVATNAGKISTEGNSKTPATRLAEKIQNLPSSQRPNTVAVIKTQDGRYIVGRNSGGVVNNEVQEALDDIGMNSFQGNCAEVNAISRAKNKGIDLEGASISIANVRGPNSTSGVHGTYKPPCSTCAPLIDFFQLNINK